MPTQNEELLKQTVEELQSKVQEVTTYLTLLKNTFDQISITNETVPVSHGELFYSTQSIYLNLPFYASPGDCSVEVYVDEGSGKHRAITPIITYLGNCMQIDLDVPKTGYIIVHGMGTMTPLDVSYPPSMFCPTFITLVDEDPKQFEPANKVDGEIDKWLR